MKNRWVLTRAKIRIDERFKTTGDTSSVEKLKQEGRFILEVY